MALTQNAPQVAVDYAASLRTETGAAISAALRLWRDPRTKRDLESGFMYALPGLLEIANATQLQVSQMAQEYIPAVLDATGQSRANVPAWDIDEGAYVGTAGNGRPTETLLYGAVTHTKEAIGGGAAYAEARNRGGQYLSTALGTLFSDTSRGMEGFETFSRPVAGYVRMLTPPSCGRCVILAGKWTRKQQPFQRHPGCDCRNIPAAESIGGDMTVNTDAYLGGLDDDALAKTLGSKANATAYREFGADSRQLVNAYRRSGGIRSAQVYGRNVKYTTEGTTVRGVAAHQMRRVRALSTLEKNGGRYRTLTAPRLMPESIFALAKNREHAERLLRDYGWLGFTR